MKRRDDFNAGYSAAILVFMVLSVIGAHGHKDSGSVTWGDVAFFIFLMAIFAACVIDVHGYWQRRKNSPDRQLIINYRSREERDKEWSKIKDLFTKKWGKKS